MSSSSSSKWRALQRRHKWSYDALRLPASLLHRLKGIIHPSSGDPGALPLGRFVQTVLDMVQLPSIHSQVAALKSVISSFQELVQAAKFVNVGASEELQTALPLLVELLFLENSVALHRSILSCLASVPEGLSSLTSAAFCQCCVDYGVGGYKERRFGLVAVANSLINLPKPGALKGMLDMLAGMGAESVSHGVQSVLREACKGGRPTPSMMEECQDALSCLYYMLQYYPHRLIVPCARVDHWSLMSADVNEESPDDHRLKTTPSPVDPEKQYSVYHSAVNVVLNVLQTGYLSRDCSIAAGVGLCAAAQFETSHWELALILSNSLFAASGKKFVAPLKEGLRSGHLHEAKLEVAIMELRGTTLADEVRKFTDFGRVCTLRGLLTAIHRPVLNFNLLYAVSENTRQKTTIFVWSLLFDGILPDLCQLLESSVDSHFKFHSVTALQICLQQIKASITMGITTSALAELQGAADYHGLCINPYCPIPDAAVQRMLQIVWNNWEDPLNQTVKQIQVVFNLLVDVQCLFFDGKVQGIFSDEQKILTKETQSGGEYRIREFLIAIAKELLSVGGHRKGRYVPLASLTLRLGAQNMLLLSGNLLFETINAMVDDDVCCSASAFLKVFLERLREECWSSEAGVTEGNVAFRRLCLPPIIAGMVSGNSRLRINLNIYALPVALQIDSDAILSMISFAICDEMSEAEEIVGWHELQGSMGLPNQLMTNQRVALLVGLLKVARSLSLMEGDICCSSDVLTSFGSQQRDFEYSLDAVALVSIKRNIFHVPLVLLLLAVTHSEESLRIDAAEAFCLNPKTASMPSHVELALLKISIPLNMRCSSTSFRMKWTSLFKKFFLRVRTSIERQRKAEAVKIKMKSSGKGENLPDDELYFTMAVDVEQMHSFMEWFSQTMIFSVYPSAPYERKHMAMELIAVMLDHWRPAEASDSMFPKDHSMVHRFLTQDATMVLVEAIVDSWDRLREGAFRILMSYPSPLPGFESPSEVEKVLKWAVKLVNSPRVRESDAGALVLRLLFRKYIVELGWTLKLHPELAVISTTYSDENERNMKIGVAVGNFIESLNDWLEWGVIEGEKDLVRACRHSFVHGALLAFRYTMDELDWNSSFLSAGASQLQNSIARLISLLTRVTAVALWVVSADALSMRDKMGSSQLENPDVDLFVEDEDTKGVDDWMDLAVGQGDQEDTGYMAPTEQAIMVGCWLAMKEVSLLLGTVTRKVPLPGFRSESTGGCDKPPLVSLLDLNQLEMIGNHFLQVLFLMKHNGAIDKTRAGFVALCNRLLCSSDSRLSKMPEAWLQQLMDRTAAKGQTVDDLIRRSAGIPAAFLALFLAEPEGTPKKLLFIAMRWILDLASSFLTRSAAEFGVAKTMRPSSDAATFTETDECVTMRLVDTIPGVLKLRDEGVVPTVHAFNVMRVTFNDTNLATDSSGFCAEGLMVAIRAFSCHHWEVRNAATLAFTALLRRMVGFFNIHSSESARRAITGFEFFHRYPVLHPFLLDELRNATLQFVDHDGDDYLIGSEKQNLSRTLHPSLTPVLIILSRLKPSIINCSTDDWLSPTAFMPYVSRCATQSNLKVRVLASHALAPLVVADNLLQMLCGLIKCLPLQGDGSLIGYSSSKQPDTTISSIFSAGFGESRLSSCRMSFNAIHGVLLQMQSLLSCNCINLPLNLSIRKDILVLLPGALRQVDRLRLFQCPMVAAAFLEVIHSLARFEETCSLSDQAGVCRDFLIQTSATFLDDTQIKEQWDPTKVLLRSRACKFYFTATLLQWPPDVSQLICNEEYENMYDEQNGFVLENGQSQAIHILKNRESCLLWLKRCMFDFTYEVRLGLLKVLKSFLDLLESKCAGESVDHILRWLTCKVHPLLIECLNVETYPRCVRYALEDYFTLSMLQLKVWKTTPCSLQLDSRSSKQASSPFGGNTEKSRALSLWRLFLKLYQTTKHGKTQAVALCCLGLCVRHLTEGIARVSTAMKSNCYQEELFMDAEEWHSTREPIYTWLALIKKHSSASEPVMLRQATAKAAIASGLLEQLELIGTHHKDCDCSSFEPSFTGQLLSRADGDKHAMDGCMLVSWYGRAILDVWLICIKLLEDEDFDLREDLATAVLRTISSVLQNERFGSERDDLVPSQVERVIQLSFEFLTLQLSHSMVYRHTLADWVLREVADVDVMQDDRDLVRRLFDKEIDNHHEEKLLFTQLCCFHLTKSLNNVLGHDEARPAVEHTRCSEVSGMCGLSEFVVHWRSKFLASLHTYFERCLALERELQWLGGLTNHPDVFRGFYPILLGLLALAGPVEGAGKQLAFLDELSKVAETIKPLVTNRLIFNLLLTLLKSYEERFGVQLGASSLQKTNPHLILESFDPYFLLR